MSEHTPTIEQGCTAYCDGLAGTSRTRAESAAEFHRMIAEVERAAAEKATDALLIELLPVLENAVSDAYLCQNDRGIEDEWDSEIAQAEAALERARTTRQRREKKDHERPEV